MPSINSVTLGGNLVRDPDIKYAKTGNAYARFNIANTVLRRDKDGQQCKEPFWSPTCLAFKELAERLSGRKEGRFSPADRLPAQ